MEKIGLIITIAVLLEALVEYFKTVIKTFEGDKKLGITHLATIVIGVGFAFLFNLHLFEALNIVVSPVADTVLTGVIISRGSNYVSDLIKRLTAAPADNFADFEEYEEDDKEEADD